MKRRLFWKILLAFGLTFFAITQGLWLLFELNRADRPSPERFMMEEVGPALLQAGKQIVAISGPAAWSGYVASLPAHQRERLRMDSDGARPEASGGEELAVLVEGADGQRYRLSYLGRPEQPRSVNTPPELIVLGLLGGLAFSAALAWYLTEPINRLRKGFDSLARGELDVRLAPSIGGRRDEIADLGRDFDMMAQRLQQLVLARDRLLHDVSHELRSPLARMQLAIGLAQQKDERSGLSLDRIQHEAQRLEMLVGELLTLARAEHGQSSAEEYFDLAGIVASVTDDARFEAAASDVAIQLLQDVPAEDDRPLLEGSAELVRRAIDNVLRNALRFSRSGQTITVRIAYSGTDVLYRVEISDEGPGISDAEMATIFNPFMRGGEQGEGFGLGLSIASRAVIAHGGTVEAANRPAGGLTVVMSFPAAV